MYIEMTDLHNAHFAFEADGIVYLWWKFWAVIDS